MSKVGTAKQLAKQTIEQEHNMASRQQANSAAEEMAWFVQTLQKIYLNSEKQSLQLTAIMQQADQMEARTQAIEKDHWKQVRMLIGWIIGPLILSIITLLILISS